MKKIFLTIVSILILSVFEKSVFAYDLNQRIDIFTPAFQLVFNDFADKFAKGNVNFIGLNPPVLNVLNANKFSSEDVCAQSYYKIAAPKSPELKTLIEKEIFEKFGEKSKILDEIDWTQRKAKEYILYAMLKKDVEFPQEYQILESAKFNNSKENVKYFGVTKEAYEYKKEIKPLFYKNKNEFAVSLTTKEGDKIVLYRTNSPDNVYDLYPMVLFKTKDAMLFGENDKLYVPFISINEKIEYSMLANRKIAGTRYFIAKAFEDVEFKLDNKGAKLRNEAAMHVMNMSMPIPGMEKVYNFNKPFIVYLIEKDKTNPYFAIRIANTKFLVKE